MMNNLLDNIGVRDMYIITLGICPLLGAANNMSTGMAIGIVYLSALTFLSLMMSMVRSLVPVELRITAIVLAFTTILSLVHIFLQFRFYELSLKLGMYVPLIAMNCLALSLAEEYALRHDVARSLARGLLVGMEILLLMIVLGTIREYGLSIINQPAGAFLLLAFVLAGLQWFTLRHRQVSTAIT